MREWLRAAAWAVYHTIIFVGMGLVLFAVMLYVIAFGWIRHEKVER